MVTRVSLQTFVSLVGQFDIEGRHINVVNEKAHIETYGVPRRCYDSFQKRILKHRKLETEETSWIHYMEEDNNYTSNVQ